MSESISRTPQRQPGRAIARARDLAAAAAPPGAQARRGGDPGDTDRGRAGASREPAVVAGNRAGVVEWVSPGWTRITGLGIDETVQKPILHFLERAEIELDVVDFVGQHFLEGRRCSVQLPFASAEGRDVLIHLEVEPIRDERGDVAEFLAVAREIDSSHTTDATETAETTDREVPASDAHRQAPARPAAAAGAAEPSDPTRCPSALDLSQVARRTVASLAISAPPGLEFDLGLTAGLEPLTLAPDRLEALLRALVEAAREAVGEQAGFVTVLTGRSQANRSHVSAAYPFPVRPEALSRGAHLHLEVHDTGAPLDLEAIERVSSGRPSEAVQEQRLSRARSLVEWLGGSLHLASRPGCGNQALVLFPIPGDRVVSQRT